MTILVAAGDSFTFGAELQDDNPGPSSYAWPRIVADCLGWKTHNVAASGNSNDAIARKAITAIEQLKDYDLFVAVMWSFPNRFEYAFPFETNTRDTPYRSITAWDNVSFGEIKKQLRNNDPFVLEHHKNNIKWLEETGIADLSRSIYATTGELHETITSLKNIVLLQSVLENKNIPYIFTICDNALFENYFFKNPDESTHVLKNLINWNNWFLPDQIGFDQWAHNNKYEYGACHPLEQAHADFAKLITEKINVQLGQKNIQQDQT